MGVSLWAVKTWKLIQIPIWPTKKHILTDALDNFKQGGVRQFIEKLFYLILRLCAQYFVQDCWSVNYSLHKLPKEFHQTWAIFVWYIKVSFFLVSDVK